MTDMFQDFLDSANAEFDAAPTKRSDPKYARKTFTCEACNGSGLWRGGRTNQHGNAKCNVCHGKGELVTSPEARAKARTASRNAKAKKAQNAHEANMARGDGKLMGFLRENAHWNTFCQSLLEWDAAGREWSDKQVEAARRMWVKIETGRRERAAARAAAEAAAPKADGARIREMFDAALAAGKKRRALHAGNFDEATGALLNKVVMTPARAPRTEIWVKVDGEFCGGIKDTGTLALNRSAPDWLPARLLAIAADPDSECRLYGRRTGTCACCGRELTNALSIKLGIGPICRAKWGLG